MLSGLQLECKKKINHLLATINFVPPSHWRFDEQRCVFTAHSSVSQAPPRSMVSTFSAFCFKGKNVSLPAYGFIIFIKLAIELGSSLGGGRGCCCCTGVLFNGHVVSHGELHGAVQGVLLVI